MSNVRVVLAHGAWADGSSWAKIIAPLAAEGIEVVAAPLPLTSLADDVAALDRTLERGATPTVLVGHAYAGAVIGATRNENVKALVTSPPWRRTKAKPSPTSSSASRRIRRRRSSQPTAMA